MNLVNSSIVFVFKNAFADDLLIRIFKNFGFFDEKLLPIKTLNNWRILPPIKLENGLELQFVENRVILQITYAEPIPTEGVEELEDGLLTLAKKLYENFMKLEFNAIGINFKVLIPKNNLSKYNNIFNIKSVVNQIKFEVNSEPFINKIEYINAKQKEKPEEEAILVVSNFHKDVQDSNEILELLNLRDRCMLNLIEVIKNA